MSAETYPAGAVTSQLTTLADRPLSSRAIAAADALIQCAFLIRVKCPDPFPPLFARLSSLADLSVPTLCPSANKRTRDGDGLINFMQYDLSDALGTLGRLDMMDAINIARGLFGKLLANGKAIAIALERAGRSTWRINVARTFVTLFYQLP